MGPATLAVADLWGGPRCELRRGIGRICSHLTSRTLLLRLSRRTGRSSTTSPPDDLASTSAALVADVVAVQEVGPPRVLDDLTAEIGGTWHTEVAAPDGRGIRVGLKCHGVRCETSSR